MDILLKLRVGTMLQSVRPSPIPENKGRDSLSVGRLWNTTMLLILWMRIVTRKETVTRTLMKSDEDIEADGDENINYGDEGGNIV